MIEVDKMGIMMLKKFVKYVSQNMLGMVGMSVYILADTYFISVAVGTDGITALNLVLPVYNMIFAMRGNDGCRFSDPSGDRAESGTSECRRILFPCTVMGIDCWPAFYACRNIFPG